MAAFLDEYEKISAARMHGRGVMSVRKGRRPISVANLLRKEKDGKLTKFTHAKEAATGGDSAGKPDDVSGGWADEGAAKSPKHPGELPPEVKSTTLSTKEGGVFDKARSLGAGAVKHVQEHAAQAAKTHLHAGVDEVAAAVKPHIEEATHRLIEAGGKAQRESAGEIGRHAGRAAVDAVKDDAKKVWNNHKGKILGGAAAAYGANKAVDYSIQKHAAFCDELEKIAKPRWAREIGTLVSGAQAAYSADPFASSAKRQAAKLYARAENIGRAMSDARVREVQPLGRGVHATGHLMVGRGVSTAENPLVAVKHVSRYDGPDSIIAHLQQREQIGQLLPQDTAKSLGSVVGPSLAAEKRPWFHKTDAPLAGLHKQEFLPYKPSDEDMRQAHNHLAPLLERHNIQDVMENGTNVRLDRMFQPRILDASIGRPAMSIQHGNLRERRLEHAKTLPSLLTKEGAFFGELARVANAMGRRGLAKIATVPGAMGSVNPFNTGENPMSSPETRKKPSPGDIPSEGWEGLQDGPLNPSQMTGPGIYATPANKMKRKGDVPTKEKDPSAVDRLDGRGEATTITGLAQNSADIGASNQPPEHVG